MSEDRSSSLTIAPPEPNLVSGLPPLQTVNPLSPPTLTPAVGPSLVNPLAPTRTAPIRPLRPSRAVAPQTVQAREIPVGGLEPDNQTYSFLRDQRARFKQELDQNPDLKRRFAAIIAMEDAPHGTAVAESLFNRMSYTGGTVASGIGGGANSFYMPVRKGAVEGFQSKMKPEDMNANLDAIDRALAGSNVIRGHTDQGEPGDPNYDTGGPGVTFSDKERYNDWGGDPDSVARARSFRMQQQAQLGDPDKEPYVTAPSGYKSGISTASSSVSGLPTTHALSLPYGPQDQASVDQTQALPPSTALSQPPGLLGSPGLLALAMGLSGRRFGATPISYDPWAIEQRGQASMDPPGSMGLMGYSIPRVGSKVPGPA